MSNCLVVRNAEGRIIDVTTPSGQKSKLFEAIHGNIFLGNAEDSFESLKNAYSDEVLDLFKDSDINKYDTGEPQLFYKSEKGEEFTDLEDLIIAGDTGLTSMGFKNPSTGEFMKIGSFDSMSSTKNKFLAGQVQNGLLSAKRVINSKGETLFQGKGEYEESRIASARGVQFEARAELGKSIKDPNWDGTIDMGFDEDYLPTSTKDGVGAVHFSEVLKKSSNFDNKIELIAAATLLNKMYEEQNPSSKMTKKDEEALQDSLLNFLNSMGFTLSTLESYREDYKTKFGKDLNIAAIADMANKVVAIAEGKDVTKELLEEVAHIAIESYSEQNSIESALALVHLTPEYTEFSSIYREKYGETLEGLALDTKVRKEVLGKILSKTISERFSTENKTPEQKTIIGKLLDIWNNFKKFLSSNFGGYEKQTIDSLNEKIADSILKGSDVFNKDFKSTEFFYDLTDASSKKIISELKKTRQIIESLYGTVLKQSTPDSSALQKIVEDMKETDVLSSISAIKGITSTLLNKVSNSIKTATKNNTAIAQQDNNIFNTITENTIPSLENLRAMLEALPIEIESNKDIKEQLLRSIDDTILQHSKLRPLVDQDHSRRVTELVEEALSNSALTEDEKIELRNKMESELADVGMLARWFGLASQNKNLFIQLLHQKAVQMGINTTIQLKQQGDALLEKISEKGYQKYQKSIIKKYNGKSSYYYISPINDSAHDEDTLETKIELIKKHSGRTTEAIRKALANGVKPAQLIQSEKAQKEYLKDLKEATQALNEQARSDDYYVERQAKYDNANVSEYTREVLAIISKDRAKVVASARNADGTIDRTKMSDSDKFEENAIQIRYKLHKSPYDQNGNLKPGLKLASLSEMTAEQLKALPFKNNIPADDTSTFVVLAEGQTPDTISDEARVAFDMSNLSMTYKFDLASSNRSTEASAAFEDELLNVENVGGNSFEWLQANSSMSLSSEFFDRGENGKTYEESAQDFINEIEDDVLREQNQNVLDQIKELKAARAGLLKQYRSSKNILEINAQNIEPLTKAKLLEIENQIDLNKSYLEIPFEASEEEERTTVKSTNDAYEKDLIEFGTNRRLQFALQHVPNSRQGKITTFSRAINNLLNGGTKYTTDYYESRIQKAIDEGQISKDMLESFRNGDLKVREEIKEILVYEYAKENVAGYYQRFEPNGYAELMSALEDGTVKASDLVKNKSAIEATYPAAKFIEINPDYTWLKDVGKDDFKNDQYMTDGSFIQPKVDKYADKEFFDKFGIDIKTWKKNPTRDLEKMTPTKNVEEYEFLKMMIGVNKQVIENYGDQTTANPFLRPQLSKTILEDLQKLDVKDFFREIVKNRADDKDYGEQIEGQNLTELGVRILPKYFQTKLEQPNAATENTIHAAMLNLKQSILYKERQKAESDFKALEFAIANQTFQTKGGVLAKRKIEVKGQTSEYLKYAKEYIGHHLYGVRQTRNMHISVGGREFDVTRLVNKMQSFVRFSNLAFNPFVDAVSATTGVLNNLSDRVAGDYYHKSSANKALSQLISLMPEYLSESGKMNKASVLNHLVEFYGLQDFDSKVKNSAYSRAIRMGADSAYKMSKLANIPVGPRSLLAVLNDYRFVDGRFVNWDQFLKIRRNEDKTISSTVVEAEWAKYAEDSLYENIKVDKKGITFNDKFKGKFENPQEEFDKLSLVVSQRAISLAQMSDGVINEYDQVAAQRDVLTNTVMMHRGWLPILLTRRFKTRRYNLSMGRVEEGHFNTLFRFMGDAIKSLKGGKPIKEVIADMEQFEKNNLRRSAFESTLWIGLLLLGEAILGADDDDDSYFEDLMQYIYVRTVSEYSSQQVFGITGTLVDVVKNPVVPIRTLEAIEPVQLLGNLVTGDFAEIGKKLQKNTILKRVTQLTDIQQQLDSYRFFNKSTLYNLAPDSKKE